MSRLDEIGQRVASVLELASIKGEFATERGASLLVEITTIDVPWLVGEVERLTTEAADWRESCIHAASDRDRAMGELSELRWRINGGMINDVGSSEPTWRD